jgi:hypothetical protein
MWSKEHLGGYLAGGVREAGSLGAAVWLVGLWMMQRFGRLSEQATMLLCLGGNVNLPRFNSLVRPVHLLI